MYLIDTNILAEGRVGILVVFFPGSGVNQAILPLPGRPFFHTKVRDETVVWDDQVNKWFKECVPPEA